MSSHITVNAIRYEFGDLLNFHAWHRFDHAVVMLALSQEPHSSTELRKITGWSQPKMARCLTELYEKGMTLHARGIGGDRRVLTYGLTPTGLGIVRQARDNSTETEP